jgi:hypothetical protein
MLGNSPGGRLASAALFVAVAVALAGCPRNIKQDKNSGKDAKWKGAQTIALEPNGTAEESGIVTYPGGDRVDWKLIELPEGKKGSLELELSWKPPRPGLDLAFDVYNEWGEKLGGVKPKKPSATKKSKKKRGKKSTTLDLARGKIYVEVYASNRGDAGKYRLKVKFAEETLAAQKTFELDPSTIPEPPKLAAVPAPCDPNAIDEKNPECKGVTKPCDLKAYDPANPACANICPDPKKPDATIDACIKYFPECDPDAIDKTNPRCTGVKPPVKPTSGLIIAVEVQSGGTIIHINKGTKDGVDRNWTGEIVDGSGKAVKDGAFTVYKAQERKSFAKVKLGRDAVNKNLNVQLYPP